MLANKRALLVQCQLWELEMRTFRQEGFFDLIFSDDDKKVIAGFGRHGTSPELRRKGGGGKYRPVA
jgi:hypothetical protein